MPHFAMPNISISPAFLLVDRKLFERTGLQHKSTNFFPAFIACLLRCDFNS
jgi:hypothetical protein